MRPKKQESLEGKKKKSIKCWEFFKCEQKDCPAYESKNLRCWLFSGTHCRKKIQGKFIEKMEMCLDCKPFKTNIDTIALKDTIRVINKQFEEYKKIVADRDKEIRSTSMELAIGLSETFEALKKISSGDNSLNLNEKSKIELISKLKHVVNKTSKEIRQAQETMQFTQFAVDHTADAAFWMRSDARFVYVNQAACRSLGYSRKELLSMTVNDIDLSFPKKLWTKYWQDIRKRKSFTFESIYKAKDGHTFPVEVTVNYVKFKGDEYNCAFARDITKSKQAQEKLKESEEKYRLLFTTETDAIVVFDAKTQQFIDVNDAAVNIYGYTRKKFLNMKLRNILTKPDEAEKTIQSCLSGKIVAIPLRYHKKMDGTIFPVEISVGSFNLKGRTVLFEVIKDITERRKAEEKLRESEKRFKQIAENAEEWIWEVNTKGLYTYSSPTVKRVLGYRPEEIIGKKHFYDLFHPEDRKKLKKAALENFTQKKAFREFINRNIHKNGKTVWLSTSAVSILDERGNLLGYRGADTDITLRKHAEEALRESEEKFRAISNTAADGIFLMDSEGKISYWNPAASRMFGYKTEEALGKELHILLAPERYHKEYKKGFRIFQKSGQGIAFGNKLEFFAIKKNGTEFPIEVSTSSLKLGDNLCAVGIVRDVTARKQAEEELRKAELRYRTVSDFTHDWEYWEDPQGKLLYVSPSCQRITGFRPEQFINNPHLIHQITIPEDKDNWEKHRHDSFEALGQQSIIFRIKRRDGKRCWIEHVCQPIIDKQGTFLGIRASNRDITIRKHAEEKLKKSYEKLRALTSRITEIEEVEKLRVARELHDQVGQNLTALSINLDFLIKHLSNASKISIGSRLNDSKDLVKDIMKLVRNMMADLRPRILDDYGLAPAIHWYSDQFSKRTKIPVSFKGEEIKLRLPSVIETNLFRIMQESLTNVAKHAHANKVTITLEEIKGRIRLVIADDGIGFNPARITHSKKKGFGMIGMKERAEALGGTMHVESTPGRGTQVIVEIMR